MTRLRLFSRERKNTKESTTPNKTTKQHTIAFSIECTFYKGLDEIKKHKDSELTKNIERVKSELKNKHYENPNFAYGYLEPILEINFKLPFEEIYKDPSLASNVYKILQLIKRLTLKIMLYSYKNEIDKHSSCIDDLINSIRILKLLGHQLGCQFSDLFSDCLLNYLNANTGLQNNVNIQNLAQELFISNNKKLNPGHTHLLQLIVIDPDLKYEELGLTSDMANFICKYIALTNSLALKIMANGYNLQTNELHNLLNTLQSSLIGLSSINNLIAKRILKHFSKYLEENKNLAGNTYLNTTWCEERLQEIKEITEDIEQKANSHSSASAPR